MKKYYKYKFNDIERIIILRALNMYQEETHKAFKKVSSDNFNIVAFQSISDYTYQLSKIIERFE